MSGTTKHGQLNLLRLIAAAALFPLRLTLHYAYPSPPSRPMAAVTLLSPSREGDETTSAGCGGRPYRRTRPSRFTAGPRNARLRERIEAEEK
jgi:hypothetical protein